MNHQKLHQNLNSGNLNYQNEVYRQMEKEADEDLSGKYNETMVEENNKTIHVKTYQ